MNNQELVDFLESNDGAADQYNELISSAYDSGHKETIDNLEFEIVECERHNSTWNVIFKVQDRLFRVIGSYDSWEGIDIDPSNFTEVKAKQVTRTEYEDV